MQRQEVEIAPRLLDGELLDRFTVERELGVLAAQPFERRHDLVADEAVPLVERRDQDVHRLLRRDLRERAWNVAAHPDVLVLIPQEERERVDDRLAVADEGGAGAALEPAVPEERHERGHEDEVVDARRPRGRFPWPRRRLRAPDRTRAG